MSVRRAVVFDLGNVLVGFDWAAAIREASAHTPLDEGAILAALRDEPAIVQYETGRLDDEAFCARLAETLSLDLPCEEIGRIWTEIFQRRPRMEALLERAAEASPVAILSDTSPLHWRRLSAEIPALLRAHAACLSYEIGVRKPDPRAYRFAFEALGTPPEACLFLDDKPENVEGARAAGLHAVRFTSEDDAEARVADWLGLGG